jgi:hypothetical protein
MIGSMIDCCRSSASVFSDVDHRHAVEIFQAHTITIALVGRVAPRAPFGYCQSSTVADHRLDHRPNCSQNFATHDD